MTSRWSDPAYDAEMEQARDKVVEVSTAIAKKYGKFDPFIYINYGSPFQDPLCGYGAENVAFLKKTAKKYDPKGVFQTLMPGGFKLSKTKCAPTGTHY